MPMSLGLPFDGLGVLILYAPARGQMVCSPLVGLLRVYPDHILVFNSVLRRLLPYLRTHTNTLPSYKYLYFKVCSYVLRTHTFIIQTPL